MMTPDPLIPCVVQAAFMSSVVFVQKLIFSVKERISTSRLLTFKLSNEQWSKYKIDHMVGGRFPSFAVQILGNFPNGPNALFQLPCCVDSGNIGKQVQSH
ncbi:hypothetical protein CHARACLAT_019727 [Characodon lateralis]|uniref:Uncharacterized protein n=1 Tax=Characodon lateralis TaxID=208331 RepID=A0ABU7D924_9TELE|nr:hypothetical protein [Characodon lateralis]